MTKFARPHAFLIVKRTRNWCTTWSGLKEGLCISLIGTKVYSVYMAWQRIFEDEQKVLGLRIINYKARFCGLFLVTNRVGDVKCDAHSIPSQGRA